MQTTLRMQLVTISYIIQGTSMPAYERRGTCVSCWETHLLSEKPEGKREKQYAYYASLCKAPAFFLLDWTAVLYRSFACRGEAVFAPGEVWREVISSRVAPTTPDGLVWCVRYPQPTQKKKQKNELQPVLGTEVEEDSSWLSLVALVARFRPRDKTRSV